LRLRPDPARVRGAVALLSSCLAIVCACSSTKQWEEVPGVLALYAEPLPPQAGQELVIGVSGEHVGPIDVYQGNVRIASFANVDLADERRIDVRIVAASAEIPRAITIGYDRKPLEVGAVGFPSAPDPVAPPDAGSLPSTPPTESCAGVEEVPQNVCSPVSPGRALDVRFYNGAGGPVSVSQLLAPAFEGQPCVPQLLAIVPSRSTADLATSVQAVLRVVDDRTAGVLRTVRVPDSPSCTLAIAAP